ncbi:MAG: DAK2 domain-containing protein [Oscillospiraceae bacterium]|nr:DAK2 domain-containing protein [Oscillospiraceae bacterium]
MVIDGKTLASMFVSGANNLYNNKQLVDELNVFPVPDGDTGTNMSLTVRAMSSELLTNQSGSVTKTADMMSFSTLRGAHGNSGVILSQFFRGISKSLKGKKTCTAVEFARALGKGTSAAYKAVMKPTEGTILTVAREAAAGAEAAAEAEDDITSVLSAAVERGNAALAHTPEQLPALKQAGVVDAGGQGWMLVLEGALEFLKTGSIIESDIKEPAPEAVKKKAVKKASSEDIKFKYCTEFIIEKSEPKLDVSDFKNTISAKGDCMLVIDDEEIVKVHIHTNHPGFVLEEAIKLGEMINLKIDNMKHQHKSLIDESASTESKKTADLKVKHKKPRQKKPVEIKDFGFVSVCAGKNIVAILKDLGVDRVIEGGQTMNPSTDDILKAINKVKAKTVFVMPNNKNIIMAANQAAELADGKSVMVIPTKNIPECIAAMMAFNGKKNAEQNESAMQKAMSAVKSGQITFAVRDTEIEGVQIKKNDILGITDGDISVVGETREDVLDVLVDALVDEDSEFIMVYYGKDIKKAEADAAARRLEEKYSDDEIEVMMRCGGQPLYYYIVSVE